MCTRFVQKVRTTTNDGISTVIKPIPGQKTIDSVKISIFKAKRKYKKIIFKTGDMISRKKKGSQCQMRGYSSSFIRRNRAPNIQREE